MKEESQQSPSHINRKKVDERGVRILVRERIPVGKDLIPTKRPVHPNY